MSKPTPDPIDPAELSKIAIATMREAKFPQLATVEGDQPRLRPISPVRSDRFTIYIANLRGYRKTEQIAANPKVELCYFAQNHDQVRITGEATIVTDRELIEDIWKDTPLLRQYLGATDNPEMIIYKVTPSQVLFMREWAIEYHEVPI